MPSCYFGPGWASQASQKSMYFISELDHLKWTENLHGKNSFPFATKWFMYAGGKSPLNRLRCPLSMLGATVRILQPCVTLVTVVTPAPIKSSREFPFKHCLLYKPHRWRWPGIILKRNIQVRPTRPTRPTRSQWWRPRAFPFFSSFWTSPTLSAAYLTARSNIYLHIFF